MARKTPSKSATRKPRKRKQSKAKPKSRLQRVKEKSRALLRKSARLLKVSASKVVSSIKKTLSFCAVSVLLGFALSASLFIVVLAAKMSYDCAAGLSQTVGDEIAHYFYNVAPDGTIGRAYCPMGLEVLTIPVEEITHNMHNDIVVRHVQTKQQIIIGPSCAILLH